MLDARQTLPVTARHWNGALEYDMHNLYGHTMATTTHAALQAVVGRRPFILTRCGAPLGKVQRLCRLEHLPPCGNINNKAPTNGVPSMHASAAMVYMSSPVQDYDVKVP